MAVFLYQIGIIGIISFGAYFGRTARNFIIVAAAMFTLVQVFTSWLMILQLASVFIGYLISESILSGEDTEVLNEIFEPQKQRQTTKHVIKTYEDGKRVYREYDENDNLSPEIREKIKSDKEIKRLVQQMHDNDPEFRQAQQNVLDSMFKNKKK